MPVSAGHAVRLYQNRLQVDSGGQRPPPAGSQAELLVAVGSALASKSIWTMSIEPVLAARCSTVFPIFVLMDRRQFGSFRISPTSPDLD
eukprot:m.119297 g.119297  ORF g.119297 m.119297 type:complete len:89 (-) comp13286_c0_seq1:73-339(-)